MSTMNNTNIDDWIFWLSYESEEEKERKKILGEKRGKDFSYEELKELFKYREYEHMSKLLLKYKNNSCSDDEFFEVRDFTTRPILDIMLDKIPKGKLESIRDSLLRLNENTDFNEEIQTIASKESKTIEDRFMYYVISKDRIHYIKSLSEIGKVITKNKRVNLS